MILRAVTRSPALFFVPGLYLDNGITSLNLSTCCGDRSSSRLLTIGCVPAEGARGPVPADRAARGRGRCTASESRFPVIAPCT